jgi:hypothetical protein
MSDPTKLDEAIANLNVVYEAKFVPKSQSRNSDKEEPSLNWQLTLRNVRATLMTDYMQGIAHVPGYNGAEHSKHFVDRILQATVTGKYYLKPAEHSSWMKPLPKPELRDVLHSLVLDAYVLESSGFEDWARNLGYDTDSRKAEAIYKECIEQSLKLKALIGQENLDKLRELYQDY